MSDYPKCSNPEPGPDCEHNYEGQCRHDGLICAHVESVSLCDQCGVKKVLEETRERLAKAIQVIDNMRYVDRYHSPVDFDVEDFLTDTEAFLNPPVLITGSDDPVWKEVDYEPKTPLGEKLIDLRNQAIAKGTTLLSTEEITREAIVEIPRSILLKLQEKTSLAMSASGRIYDEITKALKEA